LAHDYKHYTIDPTGYWMSEKFDGERAIWTGSKFVSRAWNTINAPDSFIKNFPKEIMMDGELFMGRENFEKTGVFRKKNPDEKDWENAVYMAFDVPNVDEEFEKRMSVLKTIISQINSPKVRFAKQIK